MKHQPERTLSHPARVTRDVTAHGHLLHFPLQPGAAGVGSALEQGAVVLAWGVHWRPLLHTPEEPFTMKRSSSKKSPGLRWAWSGVVAASLLAGCAGAEDAEAAAPVKDQEQSATAEPTPTGRPALRIQSLEAIPLDNVITSRTKSRVRARLASGMAQFYREIPVVSDTGEPVILKDDGLNGDEKAGDLVFSAITIVDLESHMKTQDRIAAFQARDPRVPLTWVTFDNRVKIDERQLTPLSKDVFRPGSVIPLTPAGLTTAVVPAASLIITHPGVVNDPTRTYDPCSNSGNPNGVWTWKHLITEMANQTLTGIDPAIFAEQWLNQENNNQIINNWLVPGRTNMNTKILNPWPRLSDGRLDLDQSPFELVAIVNRLDLGKGAGSGGYGGGSSGGGELRFVFAAVDKSSGCFKGPMLDIFEYGVPKDKCMEVKTWAQAWLALSDPLLAIGSPAYNAQLEALTEQVVVANAAPTKPNGNAINQIRRNEIMLAGPWELREWELFSGGMTPGFLSEVTTDLTPGDPRNGSPILANFININTPAILANSYTVPLTFPNITTPFLGANPRIPNPFAMFWNAPGIADLNARHKFSLNTCNSCHGRETNTVFTHINEFGNLSPFLQTGMINMNNPFNVADPVSGVVRSFFEIRDRAQHLDSVANQSCLVRAFDVRMLSVH